MGPVPLFYRVALCESLIMGSIQMDLLITVHFLFVTDQVICMNCLSLHTELQIAF